MGGPGSGRKKGSGGKGKLPMWKGRSKMHADGAYRTRSGGTITVRTGLNPKERALAKKRGKAWDNVASDFGMMIKAKKRK